jgi:hypothetical protein
MYFASFFIFYSKDFFFRQLITRYFKGLVENNLMYSFENATNYQNTASNAIGGLHDGENGGTGDSWKQYAKRGDIVLDLAGGLGGGVGAGKVVGKLKKTAKGQKVMGSSKRNSDTIVLGKTKNPNYANVAKENNYRNFDIPKKIWDRMTDFQKWGANKKFLDRAIAKNNKIKLSHNPRNPNINTGYFKKEIDYLKSKGFKLSTDGKLMIPPSK